MISQLYENCHAVSNLITGHTHGTRRKASKHLASFTVTMLLIKASAEMDFDEIWYSELLLKLTKHI